MLRPLWIRLRALVGADDGIEEEVRLHLEREIEENVARGMSAADARAHARRAFGNVASHQESARAAWRWSLVDEIGRDLRYAARVLRRDRAFAFTAIGSLGVGIAAVTAVYAVADSLLLRRLPVHNPHELVALAEHYPGRTREQITYEMYTTLRDEPGLFANLAAVYIFDRSNVATLGAAGSDPRERARVAIASGNYFETLGVGAAIGRTLLPADDQGLGAHPVAVISDRFWTVRLGRAPDVLQRSIRLNATTFRIVGVMPPGFTGEWIGRPVDFWVPVSMHHEVLVEVPAPLVNRNDAYLRLIGRLPRGVSPEAAAPRVNAVYQRTMLEWSGPNPTEETRKRLAEWTMSVEPEDHGFLSERDLLTPNLRILGMIVALALLVACANVVALLLARAAGRTREMTVRRAIGASAGRLARQLLVEGLVLSALGGVVGMLLAFWGAAALSRSLAIKPVMMFWGLSSWTSFDAGIGGRVLLGTAALCAVIGAIFGLAPLWSRPGAVALRRSRTGMGIGKTLVVTQLGLSLAVVITAGLFVRTLNRLRATPLGFDREDVLLVWTQPSAIAHTPAELRRVWSAVRQRVMEVPGVVAAGASNSALLNGNIPVAGLTYNPMIVTGVPPRTTTVQGTRSFVTPGYFDAVGMRLVSGRDFNDADADTIHRVVVLNETLARHYFPAGDAVGHLVAFPPDSIPNTRIVGVVRAATEGTPRGARALQMRTYFPYRDRESRRRIDAMMLAVRTRGDPRALVPAIRDAVRDAAPELPIVEINTVDQQLDVALASEGLIARLGSILGAVALLLSCIGLYGLLAFMTARRTSEIGIRMALGATAKSIREMVLLDGVRILALGVAAGLATAALSSRVVAARLYEVSALDPATIAVATALLVLAALLGGYLPARRAARVDPTVALRCE